MLVAGASFAALASCGRLDFNALSDGASDGIVGPDAALANLIGWWKLDESSGVAAADSSGNGEVGIVPSGARWVPGRINNGLVLDGVSQYVDVPDSSTLRVAGSWTISTWLNLSATPASGQMYTVLAKTDASGYETYSLRIDNNYGQFGTTSPGSFVVQFASAGGVDSFALETPASIQTNHWYHLAGTWNAATSLLSLYVDGQLTASTTATGMIPTTVAGEDFLIGDNAGDIDQPTAGTFDDVRIYDRPLSAAEINQLFVAPGG